MLSSTYYALDNKCWENWNGCCCLISLSVIPLCNCYNSFHHLPLSTMNTKPINDIFYTCMSMSVLIHTNTHTPQNQSPGRWTVGSLWAYTKEYWVLHCRFHQPTSRAWEATINEGSALSVRGRLCYCWKSCPALMADCSTADDVCDLGHTLERLWTLTSSL